MSSDGVSPEAFRQEFPQLETLTYLASCSQGAQSRRLVGAMNDLLTSHEQFGAPWPVWLDQVAELRRRIAGLIGASEDEIALLPCASEAAFQVANSLNWANRSAIVTTDMEFPSVAQVWQAQRTRGAHVRVAEDDGRRVTTEAIAKNISEEVALVSLPLVSFRNGARSPVSEVVSLAKKSGCRVLIDAYQGLGVMPVNVRELDCDYLIGGTMKYLLGFPGVAFLYVRGGLSDERVPELTGWFGRREALSFDPRSADFPDSARRFEVGTPAIPSIYAANAGLAVLERLNLAVVAEHISSLVDELGSELTAMGERLQHPQELNFRGPQVALVDDDPNALAEWLAARRIITAPRGRLLRIAFHYYNTVDDIRFIIRAIREYRAR